MKMPSFCSLAHIPRYKVHQDSVRTSTTKPCPFSKLRDCSGFSVGVLIPALLKKENKHPEVLFAKSKSYLFAEENVNQHLLIPPKKKKKIPLSASFQMKSPQSQQSTSGIKRLPVFCCYIKNSTSKQFIYNKYCIKAIIFCCGF